jgi:hypothetical protein
VIYELSRAVETAMRAKKYPVRVVYLPDKSVEGLQSSRIEMMRDREQGDDWEAPKGAKQNPRKYADRHVGARALIWVKSSVRGAMIGDHERECERLVDAFFCALFDAMRASAQVATFAVRDAKYLTAEELAKVGVPQAVLESWPGVVYSLRWRMPRGVYFTDYAGEGLQEIELGGITGELHIRRNADDPPEILPPPGP